MNKHKITSLTLQKRNRRRVNVFLDGEFAFGLDRMVAAWLSVGQEIDDNKIAQLKADDEREVAYQKALHYINYRPRSEKEVRDHLTGKGYSEEIIGETLARLKKIGLVDDQLFAQNWVENRSEFHPRSLKALSFELQQKGIDKEIIAQVLDDIDEENLALRAARGRMSRYRTLDWQTFRKKMYAYLSRKGFNYGVISEIVPQVWAELEEIEDEKG